MVTLEDMYTVYYLARANKRRSEDAVIFEINLERNLYNLTNAINDKTYRANANYAFISLRPRPREVFGCEMESRLIQWYIVWRILPLIEKKLTDRTFNNRAGMGTDAAINKLRRDIADVSHNFTRDGYIIQWDLKGYFPSANCDTACEQLKQIVLDGYNGDDKSDILWMIDICVHANPQMHCYLKSPRHMWSLIPEGKSILEKSEGYGGAIGFLIWQVAMNLYLDEIDHWAVDEMGLHYVRFVDDTSIVVNNKNAALLLLPIIREKYTQYGVSMHPRKFYCQHISKGCKFLGVSIKFNRTYASRRSLRNAHARVWYFNRLRNKKRFADKVISSVNSSMGMMKHRNEHKNIIALYNSLSQEWKECVSFNDERVCVQAKDGYRHKDIINYKYNRL